MRITFWALALLFPATFFAQSYNLEPGPDLEAALPLDGYGVHQIDFINITADSLALSWRMVGNTLPEDWDVSLCDNVLCYGTMPNYADMNPIAADSAAFLRLTVFPNQVSGTGQMQFWIYPTGFPQDYSMISFTFTAGTPSNTTLALNPSFRLFPNPASSVVLVQNPFAAPSPWYLFDGKGQSVRNGLLQKEETQLDLSGLPPGSYFIRISSGGVDVARQILIQH